LLRALCSSTEVFVNTLSGKTHKQIDHLSKDSKWHRRIRDIRYFRGAGCDADHCPVVAKVRERFAVSKQAVQKFDVERFNFRKLSVREFKKQYQIKISERFAVLEKLNDSEDLNRAWENIKDNIKSSAIESICLYELKQHKPWFDEECSRLLDQRTQAKMQWLQDQNQRNVDNLSNVRREASRYFKRRKDGISEI